ncbi:hypothetical protein [Bradyrhizobium sp. BR 10289]|uniref:hypothetical protein n=1 Tax=Bradyrhizobium sp. BR 10289 TaxID=2749993 RepID=UPI001C646C21|nr:hypothetical protein [Bradyrhizobium sp. BR 10289]MBW7970284.1 hypothetical protein [Bradyrhizobium sp. BR 10289]
MATIAVSQSAIKGAGWLAGKTIAIKKATAFIEDAIPNDRGGTTTMPKAAKRSISWSLGSDKAHV